MAQQTQYTKQVMQPVVNQSNANKNFNRKRDASQPNTTNARNSNLKSIQTINRAKEETKQGLQFRGNRILKENDILSLFEVMLDNAAKGTNVFVNLPRKIIQDPTLKSLCDLWYNEGSFTDKVLNKLMSVYSEKSFFHSLFSALQNPKMCTKMYQEVVKRMDDEYKEKMKNDLSAQMLVTGMVIGEILNIYKESSNEIKAEVDRASRIFSKCSREAKVLIVNLIVQLIKSGTIPFSHGAEIPLVSVVKDLFSKLDDKQTELMSYIMTCVFEELKEQSFLNGVSSMTQLQNTISNIFSAISKSTNDPQT